MVPSTSTSVTDWPSMGTVSTGWSCCQHHNSRQYRGTCQIFRTLWPSSETRNLVFLNYFPRQPSSPTLLCNEQHVISVNMHTNMYVNMHVNMHTNMSSALMHTNSNAKVFTVLTIDPHITPGIGGMPWMTHTAYSSTPRLLKAHHRTFLGTRSKASSRSMKAK